MTEKRCPLCGDLPHDEPDTEGWMELYCPSIHASEDEQEVFRSALAQKYAEVWEAEARAFFAWEDSRPERNAAWDARARSDKIAKADLPDTARPSSFELQADCDQRTEDEVARQKRDEVWQDEEFEMPPHLVVKGAAPAPRLVQATSTEQADPDDALLYIDPSQDVP